jgi:hypothetical protein
MTVDEFDHGYWYATQLKAFAGVLGIARATSLRKDQLERAIRSVLAGESIAAVASPKGDVMRAAIRDSETTLTPTRRIVRYTNDRATKAFLEREAKRLVPGLRFRSGARYRLNRWREDQIAAGARITYGDLVREYVRLCQSAAPFARIPHGRYINFVADFSANRPLATHAEIVEAWHELKRMDCPKTYRDWAKRARTAVSGRARSRHAATREK